MKTADVYRGEHMLEHLLDHRASSEEPVLAEVGGSRLLLPLERHFGDVDGARRYVNIVCLSPTVQGRYPRAEKAPAVCKRKGERRAHYEHCGIIALPENRHGLRELTVLHELAHHLTVGHGHNEIWQECFLFLIETVMAPEAALALRILWANFWSAA